MRAMHILIKECADRFTDHFAAKCQKDEVMEFEMYDIYKRFTVDMIGSCAFGVECNSLDNEKDEFFLRGKDIGTFRGIRSIKSMGFFIIPKIMRFFKVRMFSAEEIRFFYNIVSSTIEFREKHNVIRPDLIHLLMEAKKGKLKYEDSGKIDDTGFATVTESDVGKYTSTGNLGKNMQILLNSINNSNIMKHRKRDRTILCIKFLHRQILRGNILSRCCGILFIYRITKLFIKLSFSLTKTGNIAYMLSIKKHASGF